MLLITKFEPLLKHLFCFLLLLLLLNLRYDPFCKIAKMIVLTLQIFILFFKLFNLIINILYLFHFFPRYDCHILHLLLPLFLKLLQVHFYLLMMLDGVLPGYLGIIIFFFILGVCHYLIDYFDGQGFCLFYESTH